MSRFITLLALVAVFLSPSAPASEEVRLDRAPIDVRDVVSLQSGARTFVNYCLNCHSASAMRYNRLEDLGLTESQIRDNLMFAADKVGELMTISMTRKDAKDWFGVVPPDLSVIARSRGADWLYTYLRAFYRDPGNATGWNNLVFPGVAMPHVLWQLQGERIMKEEIVKDSAGREIKDEHGNSRKQVRFETLTPGLMTAIEYDVLARDLVNYLAWMAEPNQVTRKQVGIIVLFALLILVVLTYLLYREFWKDVH
jgi:ubiquinol-cytochrome c reductase cytochrome c1 subunit